MSQASWSVNRYVPRAYWSRREKTAWLPKQVSRCHALDRLSVPLGGVEKSKSSGGSLRALIWSFSLAIVIVSRVAHGSFADLSPTAEEREYFS